MIKHNGSGVYHFLLIFSFSILLDKYHATKSETLFLSVSLFFFPLFYYLPLSVIKFFLISLVGLDFMRLMITKTKSINTHIYSATSRFVWLSNSNLDSFGFNGMNSFHMPYTSHTFRTDSSFKCKGQAHFFTAKWWWRYKIVDARITTWMLRTFSFFSLFSSSTIALFTHWSILFVYNYNDLNANANTNATNIKV